MTVKRHNFETGQHVVDRRGHIRTGKIVDAGQFYVDIEWHYGLVERLRKGVVLSAVSVW